MAFVLHLSNFSILTQQMNLSIAIPAMVNNTAMPSLPNASTEGLPTGSLNRQNETPQAWEVTGPVYDWSPDVQGVLLSSLNYGSLLASLPGGYVVGIFGIRYLVGASLFVSSVLNLLIPLAADTGVALLIVLRTVQGIAQVMMSIGQYSIWVKWAPPQERNQLISITISGSPLGAVIILLAGGVLCQKLGWPSVFYIFGGIGCVCSCLWFLLIYDDPVDHPLISIQEKNYILHSQAEQDSVPDWSVPIKAMMKSLPLWGIIVSNFTEYWYFHIKLSYIPTYLSSVLQVSFTDVGSPPSEDKTEEEEEEAGSMTEETSRNHTLQAGELRSHCSGGLFSLSPYLCGLCLLICEMIILDQSGLLSALLLGVAFVCTFLSGLLADWLLSREVFRLVVIRKLFTAAGVVLPTMFSMSLSWVTSSLSATMAFFGLSFATSSLCHTGALINFMDIAPRYSGFLKGFLLAFSQTSGAISPTVAGFFISQDSELGWRNVFWLAGAVNMSGLVFYLFVAQADVQDWAETQRLTHL